MSTEIERVVGTIGPEVTLTEEVPMVRQERWEDCGGSGSRSACPLRSWPDGLSWTARPSVPAASPAADRV